MDRSVENLVLQNIEREALDKMQSYYGVDVLPAFIQRTSTPRDDAIRDSHQKYPTPPPTSRGLSFAMLCAKFDYFDERLHHHQSNQAMRHTRKRK